MVPEGISADSIAAVRSHQHFPAALHAAATGFIRIFQGNRLLNLVVTDRGRVVIANMSLYIHFFGLPDDSGPGLTPGRMKRVCAALKICSPGRAEAMLLIMQLFGYLETAPVAAGRSRRLVPTDKLIGSHRERWRMLFDAMAPILPDAEIARDALGRDEFTRALVRQLGDRFLSGTRVLDHAPELGLFAERNAGVMIMFSLLLAGGPGDGFPPQGPVSVSISELSRRFGTSRAHVRKLLRDAADEGYLTLAGGAEGRFLLRRRFKDAVENFLAAAFLYLDQCARAAMAESAQRRAAG
jgi:hypothetical protein